MRDRLRSNNPLARLSYPLDRSNRSRTLTPSSVAPVCLIGLINKGSGRCVELTFFLTGSAIGFRNSLHKWGNGAGPHISDRAVSRRATWNHGKESP